MRGFDLLELVHQKYSDVFVGKVGFIQSDACSHTRQYSGAKCEGDMLFRMATNLKNEWEVVLSLGIG